MKDKNPQRPIIIILRNRLNIPKTKKSLSTTEDDNSLVKNKSFIKSLISLYLQNNGIPFILKIMLKFEETMIEEK